MDDRKTLLEIAVSAAVGAVIGTLVALALGAHAGGILVGVLAGAVAGGLVFRPHEVIVATRLGMRAARVRIRARHIARIRTVRRRKEQRIAAAAARAAAKGSFRRTLRRVPAMLKPFAKGLALALAFLAAGGLGLWAGLSAVTLPFYLAGIGYSDAFGSAASLLFMGAFVFGWIGERLTARTPLFLPLLRRTFYRKKERKGSRTAIDRSQTPSLRTLLLEMARLAFFVGSLPVYLALYLPMLAVDALVTMLLLLASTERLAVMVGAGTGALVASCFVASGGFAALALLLAAAVGGLCGTGVYRIRQYVLAHPVEIFSV